MICDVIATFKDKNTGIFHYPGDRYECTDERFDEINSAYEGVIFLVCDEHDEDSGEGVRESVKAEEEESGKPAKKRRTAKKDEGKEVPAE